MAFILLQPYQDPSSYFMSYFFKILGIVGAEHSWKKMTGYKSEKQANISTEKPKCRQLLQVFTLKRAIIRTVLKNVC